MHKFLACAFFELRIKNFELINSWVFFYLVWRLEQLFRKTVQRYNTLTGGCGLTSVCVGQHATKYDKTRQLETVGDSVGGALRAEPAEGV